MDKAPPKKHENSKGELMLTFSLFSDDQMKPSFKAAWTRGSFSLLALSIDIKIGFSNASAIDIGCNPISDWIKYCLDSWHKISAGNQVLRVAHEG